MSEENLCTGSTKGGKYFVSCKGRLTGVQFWCSSSYYPCKSFCPGMIIVLGSDYKEVNDNDLRPNFIIIVSETANRWALYLFEVSHYKSKG